MNQDAATYTPRTDYVTNGAAGRSANERPVEITPQPVQSSQTAGAVAVEVLSDTEQCISQLEERLASMELKYEILARRIERLIRFQHTIITAFKGLGVAFGSVLGVDWDRLNVESKKG